MGWEDLKNLDSAPGTDIENNKPSQVVIDMVAVFTTQAGRRVLKYLRDNTIERPTFVQPGVGTDGIAMQKLQDMREGENNLVRRIERALKQGGVE